MITISASKPWIVLSLLFCLSLPFLSAGIEKGELPFPSEVFEVEGHKAFLILPEKSHVKQPTPWVWYAPTLGHHPDQTEAWMFKQFLDNGIAVAGVDVGESMGNPAGRKVFTALYRELTKNRGMSKKASLLARSRGGLMLYNWAAEHPDAVASVAGIYPVCNLRSYPGMKRASKAFEMSEAELDKVLKEHNPIDRLAPIAKAGVPLYHIHGDIDELVPNDENSAIMKERYDVLKGEMTLVVYEGQGHNMWSGWFKNQGLVDFIIDNARREREPRKRPRGPRAR